MNQNDQMQKETTRQALQREMAALAKERAHVNETRKNEHGSDDVLNKSGNVDMMREALREVLAYCDELKVQLGSVRIFAEQALAAERAPLRFVQSDKGSVIVVINKGATLRHAYGVVVESTAHDNSPIEVADFVQEKDALLFAKIWNSALTELAEKPPLVRLTDEEVHSFAAEFGDKFEDSYIFNADGRFSVEAFANAIMDTMQEKNK